MTPDQIVHLIVAVSAASAILSLFMLAYHLGRARAERECDRRLAAIERSYQARFLAATASVDVPLLRVKERRGRA